jgi:hypothetical protein
MTQNTDTAATAITFRDVTPESYPPSLTSRSPTIVALLQPVTTLANNEVTGRRPRSEVWLHFTKATDYQASRKATCMHCAKTFVSSSGSTSTMQLHLKTHHPNMLATSAGAKSLDRWVSVLSTTLHPFSCFFDSRAWRSTPRLISNLLFLRSAATKTPFSPGELRKRLLRWVVRSDQPFSTIEDPDFRLMLDLLKPEIVVPSANTIKNEIMKTYEEMKARIGDRLCNAGCKISLTLDCWTSPNTKAFLGITGHYIDNAWVPQSLVLDFAPLPGLHKGAELCEVLVATCEQFCILSKVLGITTDNASNNNTLLDCFRGVCHSRCIVFDKEEQHMRCMAHIVNLAVQALLRELRVEIPDADPSLDDGDDDDVDDEAAPSGQWSCITKLRRLVFKIRSSPQRRNAFKHQCIACGIPAKELVLDTRTRWNSTYAMIKRARELRSSLYGLTNTQPGLPQLSDEEWKLLDVAEQLLGAFDKVTRRLSATEYPTLNRVVPIYNHLFNKLEDLRDVCDGLADCQGNAAITDQCSPTSKRVLRNAIQAAYDKIKEYYDKTWAGMYAIAVILDPRCKMVYYEVNEWDEGMIAHAKAALTRAVAEYGAAESQSDQADGATLCYSSDQESFQAIKRRCVEKGSEMERYLGTPTADMNEDVLEWWKRHADDYPCLSRIARDYLAIPATSVPAERVFSGGANLITNKRGSLDEGTIQACLCLRSWLQC